MADEVVIDNQEAPVVIPNLFDSDNWNSDPLDAPVIPAVEEEKIEQIVEDKIEEKIEEVNPAADDKPTETKKEFANEVSEKIHNLLIEGKEEEVMTYLVEQRKLSEVDKLSPAEAIMMQLEYANKDYSADEIQDIFDEKYKMPEPLVQDFDELEEDFEARKTKHEKEVAKIESRMARDAKPAIAELLKLKQEIVLPYTPKEAVESVKELTQEELETLQAQSESFLKAVGEEVSKFDGYSTTYKDGEVEVSVGYKLTAEQKNEIVPLVAKAETDAPAFLREIGWLNDKNEINTSKLIKDLPFILRGEQMLQDITENAGNKSLAEAKKSIKNIDYSGKSSGGDNMGKTPEQAQKEFVSHFFQQ